MYFEDDDGHLASMPAKWTDVVVPDPFVAIAAGRALFRPDDLATIVALLQPAHG